ncbi:cytochrome oxidase assembly protein [Occultella glacieicola]|uniref:Cytochrome oxidase assembly protein n=1 Tax=Occultella glacieicola TaxID=2518684 RepID=A0ABY2DZI4_9MICO|nr:COX15/CtaA family protein [Occultella glacieicola]TDE90293.1 cytochrome oxidase assembly protein [Occultella glacieicola]
MSPATHTKLTGAAIVANLIGQILIIGTGGAVRLTGSGLGCSTWPQCEPGQFAPTFHEAATYHPFVEFGNRTMSGVLVAISAAVVLLVFTQERAGVTPVRDRGFRRLALVPLIGVLVQAVVGGITVLIELHPVIVGSHFLLSAALVWVSTVLLLRWREGDGAPVSVVAPAVRVLGRVLAALAGLVVVLGVVVTGAGPHSGDDEVGYRFAVDPLLVTRFHSGTVWVFVGVLGLLLVALYRARPQADVPDGAAALVTARRRGWVLVAVTALQGAIGYYQYFNGLPELVVGMHLVGSALLIVATTVAVFGLRIRPVTPAAAGSVTSVDAGAA